MQCLCGGTARWRIARWCSGCLWSNCDDYLEEPICACAATAARTAFWQHRRAPYRRPAPNNFFYLQKITKRRAAPVPRRFLGREDRSSSGTAGHLQASFCDIIRTPQPSTADRGSSSSRELCIHKRKRWCKAPSSIPLGCEPEGAEFFRLRRRVKRSPGARSKRASRRRRPSKAIKAHRSAAVAGR